MPREPALRNEARLADDAGVAAEGSGYAGITLSCIARSDERVDVVLAESVALLPPETRAYNSRLGAARRRGGPDLG